MAIGKTNSIVISSSSDIMDEIFKITPTVVDSSNEEEFQYDNYNAPFIDSTSNEYDGVKNIQVRKIGSWIDSEISADNIREGHSILGVAGNVIQLDAQPNVSVKPSNKEQIITPTEEYNSLSQVTVQAVALEEKTITPTTSGQTITPTGDNVGLSQVIVNGVTSDIDEDIKPENIKKDINILGVTGTYEPSYTKKDLIIEPSIEEQIITPQSQEVDAFENITVNPVTSSIDANITAKNIKKGITILGVEGDYILENLQDKVVNPTMEQQVVTFDSDQYQGLNTVTVNAVTASIDDDIKPENIKSGINILGVDGSYSGDMNIEDNVTAEPKTTPVIVSPSDGYDAMSQVTINAVTSAIDTNILAENIKKGISILGVEGTLESSSSNIQSEKTVEPSVADITVNPDEGYDALLKVIVKAVTASIDPNILSKNIKYGVNILGVVGELVEGKPQQWFDFEDMKQITQITTNTMGAGGDDSLDVKLNENDYTVEASVITEDFKAISNISAILFNIVLGYDDETVEYPIISQPFIYFTAGYYYSSYTDFHLIPNRVSYIYNYNNEIGVDGCLLNYVDTGAEKTLKLYVMIGEKEPRPILVDGDLSSEMLPDGYSSFKYVKEITIPEHTLFEPKYTDDGELNWVLKDRKGVSYIANEETDNYPANISVSAFDKNYGEEESLSDKTIFISSNDFSINGELTIDNQTSIASNFSNANYIRYDKSILYSESSNWSIEFRIKINELNHYQYWYNKHFHWGLNSFNSMVIFNMKRQDSSSTIINGTTGTTTFEANKWYYVKLAYDSSTNKYIAYSKVNAEDDWTIEFEVSSTYKLSNSTQIDIGSNIDNSSEYMYGEIDLSETIITLDNVIVWQPYNRKTIKVSSHNIIPITNDILLTPYTKYDYNLVLESPFNNVPAVHYFGGDFHVSEDLSCIMNWNKSYHVNNGYSHGHIVLPISPVKTTGTINCSVSSESNCDYGGVYISDFIWTNASRDEIKNKIIKGNGNWIFSGSGEIQAQDYTFTVEPNKQYYLNFYYAKDGSGNSGEDRFKIYSIKYGYSGTKGNLLNYTDDGSSKQLKLFEISNNQSTVETDFVQPSLTSNGIIGKDNFAVLADSEIDKNRPAWKAFDGNITLNDTETDQWHSDLGQPHWIEFYNKNPLKVKTIEVYNGADNVLPLNWEFQYSIDGLSNWTTIVSGTNTVLEKNGKWNIEVNSNEFYNYYRLYITEGSGYDSSYTGITELKIIGKEKVNRQIMPLYVLSENEIPAEKLPEGYNTSSFIDNVQIPTHSTNWRYIIKTNTWHKV